MKHLHVLTAKNGQKISYQEFGSPAGDPIIFFHGFPGSSTQGLFFNKSQFLNDFRVIAFDRPGFGSSDFHKNRKLTDIVDVVKAITDHLKIDQFHLLGVSGGSPYAIAVASQLQHRVKTLNLLCPLGPIYKPALFIKMPLKAQALLLLGHLAPTMTEAMISRALSKMSKSKNSKEHSDKSIIEQFSAKLPQADVAIMQNPEIEKVLAQSLQDAFQQGPQGPVKEIYIFTSDWNVNLDQISIPTSIYHGSEDRVVPSSIGKFISTKIKNSKFHLIPKEGHFSLPINCIDHVLSEIKVN